MPFWLFPDLSVLFQLELAEVHTKNVRPPAYVIETVTHRSNRIEGKWFSVCS